MVFVGKSVQHKFIGFGGLGVLELMIPQPIGWVAKAAMHPTRSRFDPRSELSFLFLHGGQLVGVPRFSICDGSRCISTLEFISFMCRWVIGRYTKYNQIMAISVSVCVKAMNDHVGHCSRHAELSAGLEGKIQPVF